MVMTDNSPGRNAMFLFAESFEACGVRVRFRTAPTRSFLDLVQRLRKEGPGPRYTVTLWSGGALNPTIDILPRTKGETRRTLIRSDKAVMIGSKEEHTAEFYAVGDQMTAFFDGVQVVAVKDTSFSEGYPGIFIGSGTEILSVEATELSREDIANLASNAPSSSLSSATPTSSAAAQPGAGAMPSSQPASQPDGDQKNWVNLLARADVARDSVMVPWTIEDGVLRSPLEPKSEKSPNGHTSFVFPVEGPLLNYDVRFRMVRDVRGFTIAFGFFRDGKEGMVRVDGGFGFTLGNQNMDSRKTWFEPGEAHEFMLEVRAGVVRAFYDGQLVVDHPGELPSGVDSVFFNRQPRQPNWLSVGVCSGRISIQEASFRVVDVAAEERSKLIASDPRVTQLDAGFRGRLETDVEATFRSEVAKLNQSYVANGIARARQAAQGKGSLADVEALDAEKARIERGDGLPGEDAADLPPSLKALRATYRSTLSKFEADRSRNAAPLYDLYLGALDAYIVELTKAGKVEEATKVQGLRDHLAKEKSLLREKGAVSVSSATARTAQASPHSQADGVNEGARPSLRAAEFLVKSGGSCIAATDGRRIEIKGEADVPSQPFDLHEIGFDRLNSSMPLPVAKDFEAFAGLKELRRVWIRVPNSKLPDSAYSWLAGNEELDFLNLENAGDLTTKILDYLMSSKKLTYLSIQYAPRFDGEGLEKLPCAATVDRADFLSTGFSDKGLLGISAYTKLRELRITAKGAMTDKGLAVLGKLANLEKLFISESDFGEAAAEGIAQLEKLQELDLANTALNDKGLKKLKSLKTLKALNLRGCKVTAKGVEDFKAEVGSCLVTY